MPLVKLTASSGVDSTAGVINGPSKRYDTFTESVTTNYNTDPSISGPGYASIEFGDNRVIAVAGYEEFDLANISTPLVNQERELVVFDRVMVCRLTNKSVAANLAINTGPNHCDLPSKAVLRPGETMMYDAGVSGAGTPITPATASKFRVTPDANDAAYSIFIAGASTKTIGTASLAVTGSLSATPAIAVAGSASLAAVASALGTPAVAGSASASLAAVASIPFAASTVTFPP